MSIVRKLAVLGIGVALIALKTDIPVQAQAFINYSGDTTGAPTFNRPDDNGDSPPQSLSEFATAVPYEAQPFFVDTSQSYNFFSTNGSTSSYNNVLVLYENTFNPNDSLTNALRVNYNYSGVSTTSGFENVPLLANTQYFLVTTGFDNEDFGEYENYISASDESSSGTITPGTTNSAAVPFEISPGLGSAALAACGVIAYFKGNKKRTISAKVFSKE